MDPTPVINGYFDSWGRFASRMAEHNSRFAKEVAGSMLALRQATFNQAKAVAGEVRDELRSLSGLARQEIDQAEAVAREQADAAEREVRRQAREARRQAREAAAEKFDGLTKPELQAELEKRHLPKTGNVDELRASLIDAELEATSA
jgi:hypothetical protein